MRGKKKRKIAIKINYWSKRRKRKIDIFSFHFLQKLKSVCLIKLLEFEYEFC